MTQQEQNKKQNASLVGGLAIGAAIGAAAVLLTDKKNQKKVKSTISKAKKWADEKTKDLSAKTEETVDEIESATKEEHTKEEVHKHID